VSALPTAAMVSTLLAAIVAALVVGLRPQRRSIAQVRAILHPAAGTHVSANRPLDRVAGHNLLAPIVQRLDRSQGDGLRLARLSTHDVAARIVVGGVAVLFVTLCVIGSLIATGLLSAHPAWLVLVIGAGAMGSLTMWSDVRSSIARARRDFRRTANDFVQLVAVGLTTDQSVEEAIQFALGVGDSDMFDLLRNELATAPMRGIPLWEAIDQLGRRFDQRELCEFAGSIERQGTQGVSITDTVNTLAVAMREKALDELERDADRANANLSGPTIGFVVATMVFLAYPLAIRIGEAFGG
jgi:Flp pilus assembly protein TadB